jgi:hypothetical protein
MWGAVQQLMTAWVPLTGQVALPSCHDCKFMWSFLGRPVYFLKHSGVALLPSLLQKLTLDLSV